MRRASSRSASRASGGAAVSRSTIPSAFIATSVRKRSRWSASTGRISVSRNSRTDCASSEAVGLSATALDQVEELVLHLGRHPAEDGVLHAAVLAAQVAAALRQAADRPLDVAEHLPDVQLLRGHVPPGQLVVAREVRLDI